MSSTKSALKYLFWLLAFCNTNFTILVLMVFGSIHVFFPDLSYSIREILVIVIFITSFILGGIFPELEVFHKIPSIQARSSISKSDKIIIFILYLLLSYMFAFSFSRGSIIENSLVFPLTVENASYTLNFQNVGGYNNWIYTEKEYIDEGSMSHISHIFARNSKNDTSEFFFVAPYSLNRYMKQSSSHDRSQALRKECAKKNGIISKEKDSVTHESKKIESVFCTFTENGLRMKMFIVPIFLQEKDYILITIISEESNFETTKNDAEYILSKMEVIPKE